ncbi:tyrosinase [Coprinellus micaceus]|uniref:Tyrosinase n=1 Tax=Coprinellus micaceus TaxID=71717 RepID=A0A4Y7SK47_COPMI|nr:tyrosinase [Coprinellus micaceus]
MVVLNYLIQLLFLSLTICFTSILATPTSSKNPAIGSPCKKIYVHKEWRDIKVKDRLSYIAAVKCLMKLPSSNGGKDPSSRFEDFQATHIDLTERVHLVGQFLPWHRHLVNLYSKALRNECGYKGPIPFWDWARDGDSKVPLSASPIFDPVTGFGGSGVPGTYTVPEDTSTIPEPFRYVGCVQTGPFRQGVYTAHLGPGKLVTDHCLIRGVNETWKPMMRSGEIEKQVASTDFETFRIVIDDFTNGIHGIGHAGVGGEMTNFWSAPADPLFYLHHLNLDRMWWQWQQRDPANRLYQISGPTTQGGLIQTTMDFIMDFPRLGRNVTVRDVMDLAKEPNCFTFAY